MTISENIASVNARISAAAAESGRMPDDITLVAASKMNSAERVREAIEAGVPVCGENRVQEMLEKSALGAYAGARLHFIGRLQKNKVKNVVGLAELIHGVDSVSLLTAISKCAESRGIVQDVLLEINIGAEVSKAGFRPEELDAALSEAAGLKGIKVRGLMAIPPVCVCGDENIPYFTRMHKLFVDIGEKKYDNSSMDFLSMGMSSDFEAAIKCGANMVRIGTGIFGPRDYGGTT